MATKYGSFIDYSKAYGDDVNGIVLWLDEDTLYELEEQQARQLHDELTRLLRDLDGKESNDA